MSTVFPFHALRPSPATAAEVAAVPYDVVTADEARALAHGKPLSFLHVSRAEIDLPPDTNPYSDTVYERAAANFAALKRDAPLILESDASLYVYRLRMGTHLQTGVAGCFSLDEYDRDVIKKHERTRQDKEDDRTRHIMELRAQTGPVFLTYPVSVAIDDLVRRVTMSPALADFVAADGIQHTVWCVPSDLTAALVGAFASVPALYIADGHHRAASAARVRDRLRATAGAGEWDTFLAVAFPDNQMNVLPYNRVVRDLNGHTPASLLDGLRQRLDVRDGVPAPARSGQVSMFLDGRWYTIDLGAAPDGLAADERLDVSRLQALVLTPLLGIGDARSDKRIDFVGGARGTTALESHVAAGKAAAAFSMYPVSVADLMRISDAGGIMPPKSTWFEPKLRDGLLSHVIE
jgi:uncharacterized protein (DUF1015 family)